MADPDSGSPPPPADDDPFGQPVEGGGDDAGEEEEEEEEEAVQVVDGDDPFGQPVDADGGDDDEEEEEGEEEEVIGGDPFGGDDAPPADDDAAADDDDDGRDKLPEGFDPYASDDDEDPPPGSLQAMLKAQQAAASSPRHGGGDEEEEEEEEEGDEEEEEQAQQGGFGWGGFEDHDDGDDGDETPEVDENGFRAGFGFGGDDFGAFADEEVMTASQESSIESMKGYDDDYLDHDDHEQVAVEDGEEEEEEEKTYPEWEAASWRLRLFSMLEPSVCENMEQPNGPWAVTCTYHTFYLCVLLANGFANVAGTYEELPFDKSPLETIKLIAAGMFVFDLVFRAALMRESKYVPALIMDALTSCAELILLFVGDMGINEINYIPPLRSTRVFLFVGLFVRTETFRDINLAIRTVIASLRPLLVFIVLVIIGLLMFSTFVYLSERGDWNSQEQRWYRECHPFLSVCTGKELSPFQSIPDAMWLIIQSMTTVGYGDVTPITTTGRFVTGCAIISGVFVIAFPAMVLIGNLDQSRRDFFAQQERSELEKEYREKEQELDAAAKAEEEAAAKRAAEGTMAGASNTRGSMDATGTMHTEDTEDDGEKHQLEFVPTSRALIFGADLGEESKRIIKAHDASDFGKQAAISRADFGACDTALFDFMGSDTREVTRHPRGYWTYEPIFQVMTDPDDGLPLLTNVFPNHGPDVPEGSFLAVMIVILDDPEAQALASEAAEQLVSDGPEPMAHATPVYGLDITFKRPVPGVRLRRRVTTGIIQDHSVPVTLEIVRTESGSMEDFIHSIRRGLSKSQLVIKYNRQPLTSATWIKNVPITSVMLSTTPFIQDLRAVAINIAPREYWDLKTRTEANDFAQVRRNVAYITHRHLMLLVYPIFRKVSTPAYVLRNISDFTEGVATMIKLHCREVRKIDVPDPLQRCVYMGDTLGDFEKLYEVDVDYFRTNDWPLGTVPCEYSERLPKSELTVRVADSTKHSQPVINDIDAVRRADVNEGAFEDQVGAGAEVDVFGANF